MLADAVPFGNEINFGIEHGPTDNVPAVYGSTSYWYGCSRSAMKQANSLTVGDADSEKAHGYTSPDPGPVQTLTATYEGNDGTPVPVTATLRDTTSQVSFHLAIDPANRGVVLRRTSDQNPPAYQTAEVYVNGQDAGEWQEPLANPYHQWLDGVFQPPAALTFGKAVLNIRLVPAAGSPPWSAASYTALTETMP